MVWFGLDGGWQKRFHLELLQQTEVNTRFVRLTGVHTHTHITTLTSHTNSLPHTQNTHTTPPYAHTTSHANTHLHPTFPQNLSHKHTFLHFHKYISHATTPSILPQIHLSRKHTFHPSANTSLTQPTLTSRFSFQVKIKHFCQNILKPSCFYQNQQCFYNSRHGLN